VGTVSLIVAVSRNMAIGKDNKLLWHIPTDLRYFKQVTQNKSIIMGRKTFESIGRVLPNRHNIVVSTNPELAIPGATVVRSLDSAFEAATSDEIMVIGGAQIYAQSIHRANKLYVTQVEVDVPDADAFFPEIDKAVWRTVDAGYYQATDTHPAFVFNKMVRV